MEGREGRGWCRGLPGAGREAGGRTGAESGLRPGAERSGAEAGGPAAQQRAGSAPVAPRGSSARRCTAACERLSLGSALPLAGRAALRGPAGRSVLKSREENFSILGKQRPVSKLPFQDTPPVQEGRGKAEVVALAWLQLSTSTGLLRALCREWPACWSALRPAVLGWVLH